MKRFQGYVAIASGLALLSTVIGLLSAGPAIAQVVRAALVKNVDEKGRSPWSATRDLFPCPPGGCTLSLPPIPAGKRLVIEYISGFVIVNTPSTQPVTVELTVSFVPVAFLPVSFSTVSADTAWIVSSKILAYAEEGTTPQVLVGTSGDAAPGFVGFVVSGYLIDKSI